MSSSQEESSNAPAAHGPTGVDVGVGIGDGGGGGGGDKVTGGDKPRKKCKKTKNVSEAELFDDNIGPSIAPTSSVGAEVGGGGGGI